jgi:GTP-binding protein Era
VRRVGVIALVGRPNVGKSTLINALVGESLSIVTPKPETTRDRVTAVVTRPLGLDAQLVLQDSPGIHKPVRKLGEYMNSEARAAAEDADVVLMVVDASEGMPGVTREGHVLDAIAGVTKPVLLAVNKVDRVHPKEALLPLMEAYAKLREFATVIPVSAERGEGVDVVLRELAERVPEGVALYPEDTLTDRTMRYLAAERVREAVILETGEELPYVTAVEIEKYDERAKVPKITATIHVERPGQKKILVGAKGERIRAVGSRARASIEALVGQKVYLELWVKVTPDWTRSTEALARLGYRSQPKSR